jgi:type I restriction-modification system DNA methylase subunit
MKQEVRTMLEGMYDLFTAKFQDPAKSWDRLIEFLAVDNCGQFLCQLDHKFEWLFEDSNLAKTVMKTYNPNLLRSDYYDHLGEMYLEKVVSKDQAIRKGMFLTPMSVADAMARMTIPESKEPINILDPAVGSGRLLMAAYKRAPSAGLFGVDVDLGLVRIALTNFAIHKIPGYLLHADSLCHETDIATEHGKSNWMYANRWYSCMDKLAPLSKYQTDSGQPGVQQDGKKE